MLTLLLDCALDDSNSYPSSVSLLKSCMSKRLVQSRGRISSPYHGGGVLASSISYKLVQREDGKTQTFLQHTASIMAIGNPSTLVIEFQTKFYFKIWLLVMKYVEARVIWRLGSMIFQPNFQECNINCLKHSLNNLCLVTS